MSEIEELRAEYPAEAAKLLAPFIGRKPFMDKYAAARPETLAQVVARLDETDPGAADVLIWTIWWRHIADNRAKFMCDQFGEQSARLSLQEKQIERLREALGIADSWLERHATHVALCAGGDRCTCGLTRIRFDVSGALNDVGGA